MPLDPTRLSTLHTRAQARLQRHQSGEVPLAGIAQAEATDVLDLLAALEAAEKERSEADAAAASLQQAVEALQTVRDALAEERDRFRQALQEAHARFRMIASSPMVSEGVEQFAGAAAVSIRKALGVEEEEEPE